MVGRSYEKKPLSMVRAFLGVRNTEDLSSLFCSELVAGAYKAMGLLPEDRASADYLPVHFMWRNRHRLPLQRGAFLSKEVVIDFGRPPEHLRACRRVHLRKKGHALGIWQGCVHVGRSCVDSSQRGYPFHLVPN